jgi:hypothetical protein
MQTLLTRSSVDCVLFKGFVLLANYVLACNAIAPGGIHKFASSFHEHFVRLQLTILLHACLHGLVGLKLLPRICQGCLAWALYEFKQMGLTLQNFLQACRNGEAFGSTGELRNLPGLICLRVE